MFAKKAVGAALLVLCAAGSAANFEIVADDMRDIEETLKAVDSDVALKNAQAATGATTLEAYFRQVESFYAAKPDMAQAQTFSHAAHEHTLALQRALQAEDFTAAADAVGQLTRSCKACHDAYRQK